VLYKNYFLYYNGKMDKVKKGNKKRSFNLNKIKWKNVLLFSFMFFCISMLIVSINEGISWFKDNQKINNQVNNLLEETTITLVPDNLNTEIINQMEVDEFDPYWDYIKMNLINVDFSKLLSENDDTVAWIQVNGTNINYPVVQTNNNDYYLTRAFDKTWNDAGWVFMDYRNDPESFDSNTILYAHSRLDKTMFGSLKNILKSGWLNDIDNYVIKLSTPYENTMWQVFSVYHLPTTSDYLKVDFYDKNEFTDFINLIYNRSAYNFGTTVSSNDKILTLSTCYANDEKLVVHAKLIKREVRQDKTHHD